MGANGTRGSGPGPTDERSGSEAEIIAGRHGLLFDEPVNAVPDDVGYRGPIAAQVAGITYRQLDYWARTGLVEPTIRTATGSGSQRLYSFRDILVLKIVKRLLDTGVSLQQIRTAAGHLRQRGRRKRLRVHVRR